MHRNIRLGLGPDKLKAVADLVKTVSGSFLAEQKDFWPRAKQFVYANSPPYNVTRLDSPPLFPRDCHPGHEPAASVGEKDNSIRGARDILNLLPSKPLAVEDDRETDLYKEHMAIVNGWSTLCTLHNACGID